MLRKLIGFVVCFVLFSFPWGDAYAQVYPETRLKDIGRIEGVRSNQLVGVGLVIGLQGTGDKGDLVLAMLGNLVENFGISIDRDDLKSKNTAVVTVTCELPPFARNGQKIDVVVSSAGDAKSLEGGVLLQTPLRAANGLVYAVAQGPISIGGFSAGSGGSSVSKNFSTTGRIPGGAIVERETRWDVQDDGKIMFFLNRPDFTTADRVARAINSSYGMAIASAVDAGTVEIAVPAQYRGNLTPFVASLEGIRVRPDAVARVVINERTGTIVIGGDVRIGEVAVAHGNLTVTVKGKKDVSQPEPFSLGETVVTSEATVAAEEEPGSLAVLRTTATVDDVVKSLNALGATPRDIITILQAIAQSGALQGELVIM
ncbi:flagellar P-ring protein [Thermovirga lienii DSM 17291]|jgi:flagellar P-ring protein precursor FlgI|uniref:Flagellar P-ring protein n=1 Tax=Thermovirga lienii (strain ATCC BAA-1197 / DSM 17291 / Cas60314) TaxID=580340 RepID=G7V5V4_THELD|nr:flagellar basal body P-ring protein FlgI [Thermovirga lienii]AER65859.1 flagellar P-ring protein [Thermovirga lienii DSM 17291]MDN5318990.1 flagellar P-ring protein FlgI [Thermovirga sp.]MDN5368229.1 flagellar P-ring protein FlgI [Thermovirga sp.]